MKSISFKRFLLIFLFLPIISLAQQNKVIVNAEYTGRVEYVLGAFGSYNSPKANDSITVEVLNDSLFVKFFPDRYLDGSGTSSGFRASSKYLAVKEQYKDIITPTEEKAMGSYDIRYTIGIKK